MTSLSDYDFSTSISVVVFDTLGISRCRNTLVFVESSSLIYQSLYL